MRTAYQSDDMDGLVVWGEPDARLRNHYKSTVAKCNKEERVILVQGSTELPYALGKDGPDMWKVQKGFWAHVGLVVSEKNLALGLVCLRPWSTREDMSKLWPGQIHRDRWLDGLKSARILARRCPATQIHQVCDVGVGDGLHGLFRAHRDGAASGTLLVRVTNSGSVRFRFADSKRAVRPSRRLLRLDPVIRGFSFRYGGSGRTKSRYSRATRVSVRASGGRLEPENGKATAVTALMVTEDKAPRGLRPFQWLFVAAGQDLDATDIQELLAKYEQRWTLANYFSTLRAGVKAEGRQILDYYGGIRSRRAYERCLAQDAESSVVLSEIDRIVADVSNTPARNVLDAAFFRRLMS